MALNEIKFPMYRWIFNVIITTNILIYPTKANLTIESIPLITNQLDSIFYNLDTSCFAENFPNLIILNITDTKYMDMIDSYGKHSPPSTLLSLDLVRSGIYELENLGRRNLQVHSFSLIQESAYSSHGYVLWEAGENIHEIRESNATALNVTALGEEATFFYFDTRGDVNRNLDKNPQIPFTTWEMRFKTRSGFGFPEGSIDKIKMSRELIKRAAFWHLKIRAVVLDNKTRRFVPNEINMIINIQPTTTFRIFPILPAIIHLSDNQILGWRPLVSFKSYVRESLEVSSPMVPGRNVTSLASLNTTTTVGSTNNSSLSNNTTHISNVNLIKMGYWKLVNLSMAKLSNNFGDFFKFEELVGLLSINSDSKFLEDRRNLMLKNMISQIGSSSDSQVHNTTSKIRSSLLDALLITTTLTFGPKKQTTKLTLPRLSIDEPLSGSGGKKHEIYILEEGGIETGNQYRNPDKESVGKDRNFLRINFMNRWDQYPSFRRGYYWSVRMKERPTPSYQKLGGKKGQEVLLPTADEDTKSGTQIYLQPGKGKFLQSPFATSKRKKTEVTHFGEKEDSYPVDSYVADRKSMYGAGPSLHQVARAKKEFEYFFRRKMVPGTEEFPTNRPYLDVKRGGSILRIGNSHLLDYETDTNYLLDDIEICAKGIGVNSSRNGNYSSPEMGRSIPEESLEDLKCREFLVHLSLDNINDNYPVFGSSLYTITISELSPSYTFIARVIADDADTDSKLTYSIPLTETYAKYFEVNPLTGVVRTRTKIKGRIHKDFISFLIHAEDGDPSHTASTKISVRILKNRDERIIFTAPSNELTTFKLREDLPPGTLITVLKAAKLRSSNTFEEAGDHGTEDKTTKIRGDQRRDSGDVINDDYYDVINDDPYAIYEGSAGPGAHRYKRRTLPTADGAPGNFEAVTSRARTPIDDPTSNTDRDIDDDVTIIYEFYDPASKDYDDATSGVGKTYEQLLMAGKDSREWKDMDRIQTMYGGLFCMGTLSGELRLCGSYLEYPVRLDRESVNNYSFTIIARSISISEEPSLRTHYNRTYNYEARDSSITNKSVPTDISNSIIKLWNAKDVSSSSPKDDAFNITNRRRVITLSATYTFVKIIVEDVNDNFPRFVLNGTLSSSTDLGSLNWFRILVLKESEQPVPSLKIPEYSDTPPNSASELANSQRIFHQLMSDPPAYSPTFSNASDPGSGRVLLIPPTIHLEILEDDTYNQSSRRSQDSRGAGNPLGTEDLINWKKSLARGKKTDFLLDPEIYGNKGGGYGGPGSTREIGTLQVSDPDVGDNGTFYFCLICADFPNGHVTVDYYTGRLITDKRLDREVRSYYSALVTVKPTPFLPCDPPSYQNDNFTRPDFYRHCSDKLLIPTNLGALSHGSDLKGIEQRVSQQLDRSGTAGTSIILVNITIRDVNDHPPKFERSTFYIGLHWRTNRGSPVTRIKLIDADSEITCCRNYSFTLSDLSYYGDKGNRMSYEGKTLTRTQYEDWFSVIYQPTSSSSDPSVRNPEDINGGIVTIMNGIIGLERFVDGYFKVKITAKDRTRPEFKDSAIVYIWVYGEGRTLSVSMDVFENIRPKDISYKLFGDTLSHAISNNIILSTMDTEHELQVIKSFLATKNASSKFRTEPKEFEYEFTIPPKYSFEMPIQVVDRSSFNLLSEQQIMHLIDSKPESIYRFKISPITVTSIKPKRSPINEMRAAAYNAMTIPSLGPPDRVLTVLVFAIFVVMLSGAIVILLWMFLLGTENGESLSKRHLRPASPNINHDDSYMGVDHSLTRNTRTNPLWIDGHHLQNSIQVKNLEAIQNYYF